MKKIIVLLLLITVATALVATAQSTQTARYKIAVFAPLYLDSVFDGAGNYRYNKTFPKYLNSGLEFYQGVQLALDSLQKTAAPLEVYFYDSKNNKYTPGQQLAAPEMQDVSLIIGHSNISEVKSLAEIAATKKIPFVSVSLPNDAGVYNNPYFVILNSTLHTHCEGIYKYLQKYHASDRIILFTKNGVQEEQLKSFFEDITHSALSTRLNIQSVNIGDDFSESAIVSKLDSTRKTICIAGSLDESFGKRLVQTLSDIGSHYPASVIGMPTWDVTNFNGPDFNGVDILYTTPFYYNRYDKLSTKITNDFKSKINGKPTDMFYRGYEVMLRFALLLLETKKDIASNLSLKDNTVFTPFDIQPVLNKQTMTLDYFENKKLYFIKVFNGVKNIQY